MKSKLSNEDIKFVGNLLIKNSPQDIDKLVGSLAVQLTYYHRQRRYIVQELIERNKKKFKKFNVDFRVLDITKNELPEAEVCFLRQVLQHLSNTSILCFIRLLKKKYKYILITEHFPSTTKFIPNIDKSDGPDIRIFQNSAVVLTAPPFNLKVVKEKIICESRSKKF